MEFTVKIFTAPSTEFTYTALCGTLEEAENFASKMVRSVEAWSHPNSKVAYTVTEREANK